ncbi:MAG TPA: uroporphyrinogen-III synthase, partial [Acidimicrobiia bacterium]|nr:uroporphyrinogen-III synthase [Acidimicrobiia bacterium]
GAVAGLPEELNWFERRPLFGKRIVVTRPENQAVAMSVQLSRLGARVIELATVEIVEPPSWEPVDAALRELDTFDWVVFTSANAVNALDRRMGELGLHFSDATHVRLAAIGRATADVLSRLGPPDLVPDDFTSDGLLQAFREQGDLRNKRVLLPRSGIARAELREGLIALGAHVTEVTVYTTRTHTSPDPDTVEAVRRGACDVVTFTSSSTVQGFVEIVGRDALDAIREKVRFASIGPVTSETCRELGIPVGIEAAEHTTDGLVRAILDSASRG